jgi:hypothetical protein
MTSHLIEFFALFQLMLVTGIFWGPWFALHRSMKVFNAEEFIHIVKTMSANLARPMQIMMPSCIVFMLLSVWFYPDKNSLGFYLNLTAFTLIVVSLIITVLVEVPIVKQIEQWTATTVPSNWGAIQDRWLKFHIIRTLSSLASFATFTTSLFFLH